VEGWRRPSARGREHDETEGLWTWGSRTVLKMHEVWVEGQKCSQGIGEGKIRETIDCKMRSVNGWGLGEPLIFWEVDHIRSSGKGRGSAKQ